MLFFCFVSFLFSFTCLTKSYKSEKSYQCTMLHDNISRYFVLLFVMPWYKVLVKGVVGAVRKWSQERQQGQMKKSETAKAVKSNNLASGRFQIRAGEMKFIYIHFHFMRTFIGIRTWQMAFEMCINAILLGVLKWNTRLTDFLHVGRPKTLSKNDFWHVANSVSDPCLQKAYVFI